MSVSGISSLVQSTTHAVDISSFSVMFNWFVYHIVSSTSDGSALPENTTYSPSSFNAIKDVMHLFPMWPAVLQGNLKRLGKDYQEEGDDVGELPRCRSNAHVEAHFRSVKHGRLEGGLRVRPFQFVKLNCSTGWER